MHEWQITRALVRELTRVGTAHGAAKIVAAKVRVTTCAEMSPEQLRGQFAVAAAGTLAEGAELQIEAATNLAQEETDGIFIESIEIGE